MLRSSQAGAQAGCVQLAREKGSELVEFGLVFALLMMLLVGIVSFARAYNTYQTVTRAAREGARMAVLPSSAAAGNAYMDGTSVTESSSTIFQDFISPALQAANLDPTKVSNYSETVQWLDPSDTDEQCGVVISFQYPYTLVLPFTKLNMTTVNLNTQVQMRRENQSVTSSGGSSTATCP